MKPTEALDQLVVAGLFPRDSLDDLLQTIEHVDAKVKSGELSEDEASDLLARHGQRVIDCRERTLGAFTADEREHAVHILQAMDPKGLA